jgi:hypothetical protein
MNTDYQTYYENYEHRNLNHFLVRLNYLECMRLCFSRDNRFVFLENDFLNPTEALYSPVMLFELCAIFHTHKHWLKHLFVE